MNSQGQPLELGLLSKAVCSLYPDVTVVVDNLIEIKQNCKKGKKQSKSYEEIVS